jgi:anti-anti-sigma factor
MQMTVDRHAGRIAVSGELNFTDQGPFKEMITELFQTKGAAITIDLSKLDLIDSAGLGMLLLARDEANKIDRQLILAHPTGQVKRMFGVTKFDKLFTVEE